MPSLVSCVMVVMRSLNSFRVPRELWPTSMRMENSEKLSRSFSLRNRSRPFRRHLALAVRDEDDITLLIS